MADRPTMQSKEARNGPMMPAEPCRANRCPVPALQCDTLLLTFDLSLELLAPRRGSVDSDVRCLKSTSATCDAANTLGLGHSGLGNARAVEGGEEDTLRTKA